MFIKPFNSMKYVPLTCDAMTCILDELDDVVKRLKNGKQGNPLMYLDIALNGMPCICRIFIKHTDCSHGFELSRPEFMGLGSFVDLKKKCIRQDNNGNMKGCVLTQSAPLPQALIENSNEKEKENDKGNEILLSLAYPVYDAILAAAKQRSTETTITIEDLWGWWPERGDAHKALLDGSYAGKYLDTPMAREFIRTVKCTRNELAHHIKVCFVYIALTKDVIEHTYNLVRQANKKCVEPDLDAISSLWGLKQTVTGSSALLRNIAGRAHALNKELYDRCTARRLFWLRDRFAEIAARQKKASLYPKH